MSERTAETVLYEFIQFAEKTKRFHDVGGYRFILDDILEKKELITALYQIIDELKSE